MIRYFFNATSWFPVEASEPDYTENGVFAALALIGLLGSLVLARRFAFLYLATVQLAIWVGTLAPSFLIMQFEVRYFYIAKAVSLAAASIVLAWLFARYRTRRPVASSLNPSTASVTTTPMHP
jgi:hypothetical protein